MAPITEFLTVSLAPDANAILDPSTREGKIIKDSLAHLRAFPGVQFVKLGPKVEDKNTMHLFVVWESQEAHDAFVGDPDYPAFAEKVQSISAGHFQLDFYDLAPASAPEAALGAEAKATEVFMVFFPAAEATAEAKAAYEKKLAGFIEGTKPVAGGMVSVATGWSTGEVDSHEVEGGKAKVMMGLMGWREGVKGHMAFRETEEFKREVTRLYGPHIDMFHVTEG